MISMLYQWYVEHSERLPGEYIRLIRERGEKEERVVCDFIAGMTDQYSIARFEEIYVPVSWGKP